jgi:hypothetical protein
MLIAKIVKLILKAAENMWVFRKKHYIYDMKTTYSNVKNPKRLTWMLGSVVIVGYVSYIAMIGIDHTGWQILRMILYLAAIIALVWIPLVSVRCTVDDEEGMLFTPENRKMPMMIADIDRITRVTNKKGKVRYLNIHEAGVRFVDVRLFPVQSEALIEHLVRINPNIKVQSKNYI